jgi:hypothetical protein
MGSSPRFSGNYIFPALHESIPATLPALIAACQSIPAFCRETFFFNSKCKLEVKITARNEFVDAELV